MDIKTTVLVVKVVDGVGKIRLVDNDTPEMEAPGYDVAKNYLSNLLDYLEVFLDLNTQKDQ